MPTTERRHAPLVHPYSDEELAEIRKTHRWPRPDCIMCRVFATLDAKNAASSLDALCECGHQSRQHAPEPDERFCIRHEDCGCRAYREYRPLLTCDEFTALERRLKRGSYDYDFEQLQAILTLLADLRERMALRVCNGAKTCDPKVCKGAAMLASDLLAPEGRADG